MPDRTCSRRRVVCAGAAALFGLAGCVTRVDGDDWPPGSTTDTPPADVTTSPPPTADTTATASSAEAEATTASSTQAGTARTDGASSDLPGPRNGDDLPADTTPNDGYPPEFSEVPPERDVDVAAFDTVPRGGMEVPLVPIDVAYYWYARGEARFVDARSGAQFDVSHVLGAVLSPAGDGRDLPDDPVFEWPKDARIVTYCGCPHHLSSLRAASLTKRGYETVYALDEGFVEWRERDFPLAGSDVEREAPVRVVEGTVPPAFAGRTAWARHAASNQVEATTIDGDGRYELELRFVGMTAGSPVRVETPAYTVTEPIGRLTRATVAADGTLAA